MTALLSLLRAALLRKPNYNRQNNYSQPPQQQPYGQQVGAYGQPTQQPYGQQFQSAARGLAGAGSAGHSSLTHSTDYAQPMTGAAALAAVRLPRAAEQLHSRTERADQHRLQFGQRHDRRVQQHRTACLSVVGERSAGVQFGGKSERDVELQSQSRARAVRGYNPNAATSFNPNPVPAQPGGGVTPTRQRASIRILRPHGREGYNPNAATSFNPNPAPAQSGGYNPNAATSFNPNPAPAQSGGYNPNAAAIFDPNPAVNAPAPQQSAPKPKINRRRAPAEGRQIIKGQKIALEAAGEPPLTHIKICLGWDIKDGRCELDASAFMLGQTAGAWATSGSSSTVSPTVPTTAYTTKSLKMTPQIPMMRR